MVKKDESLDSWNFPIPTEEELKVMKEKEEQTQEPNIKYPIIEIKDMNSGDLIIDETGGQMVVYKDQNKNCTFLSKEGCRFFPKPDSEYRLVQKKLYKCPPNQIFYSKKSGAEYRSDLSRLVWYSECAMGEAEPAAKTLLLMAPCCKLPIATFMSLEEALEYKDKQDEPQHYQLCHDERGGWALVPYSVLPKIEIPDESKVFKDEIQNLKLEKEDLVHEVTRLRGVDNENDDLFRKKTELKEENLRLVEDLAYLRQTIKARDQEITSLKEFRSELENKLNNSLEQARSLTSEVSKLKERLVISGRYNSELAGEVIGLQEVNRALAEKLTAEKEHRQKVSKLIDLLGD